MSELLNLVGLSTGVVLYTMLLAMVIRVGRASGAARFDPLLLATAVLGLIWNLCALPAYELPKVGIAGPFPFLIAAGYSALGFLPAVVVQSVLRDERDRASVHGWAKRAVACAAYAVSTVAAALHALAAWGGSPDCARLLVARGADVTVKDPEHNGTPADWARHFNNPEIAAMISKA